MSPHVRRVDLYDTTLRDGTQRAGISLSVDDKLRILGRLDRLGMPYVDGRQVAAAIRANSPATPIILLTGWGQRLSDEKDIPAHVDRVLNKPPKLRELRLALIELSTRGSRKSEGRRSTPPRRK